MTVPPHPSVAEMSMLSPFTPVNIRICLVGEVAEDESCCEAARTFGVPVVTSETGLELINDYAWRTHFILKDFETALYSAIHKSKQCILGPPALIHAAAAKGDLKRNARPIYNYAMDGVVTCFTGVRKKDELTKLVNLIHSMGGGIRKDMNAQITHLISTHSSGDKYVYAKTFRLTVVRPAWVYAAWEQRDKPGFRANTEEFSSEHKLKAFEGQKICFFGFPADEHEHMVEVLESNGGIPAELDDPECSHVVVDEHATQVKPETRNQQTHILKSDWFWYTIQNGYAHEKEYLFGDYLHSIANTPNTDRRDSLPISFNNRKRKHFLQSEGSPSASKQRHSSDAHLLSVSSGSFFDCTSSPDKLETGIILNEPESSVCEETPAKKCSMRFNHFMEFYTTESNYVGILDTIVNLFKNPLEMSVKNNDALLSKSKIKAIFGNFLPIHEVHQSMLERLRAIHAKWSEDCLIGDIILQHRDDLIKAYPPYVNFFEQMKETLIQCDQEYPRFHAFLKINQIKPECGRQRLQDLMIRPVQRLPSVSLLLNDILKHTSKSNPDYLPLEEALKAIKEVTMHINEDKRKTESRIAIFDIFNDIEDCPAHLVSSNRMFISRCEVNELTNNLSGRGDSLMLYLFSDTIEVCKKRSRFNSAKSPGSTKTHKHVKLISLNAIYFVIDITDSPRAFALLCGHDKDNLYSFNIADEEVDKVIYLKALCKQMAENACRTDTNKPLLCRTSQELDVDISDINLSTLSKAFKLAARTRLKVGRAFSFNKTPSKLKRAVSTMMTPPFGSTSSLTPASQLAQMRLASCTNIHEVTQEDTCDDICNHSPAPRSVQPTRRIKFSTFGSVGRI
ncbi:epithelial cell transforming 2 pebble isoform 5-T7 [Glossina fuscipes fuscipes]